MKTHIEFPTNRRASVSKEALATMNWCMGENVNARLDEVDHYFVNVLL